MNLDLEFLRGSVNKVFGIKGGGGLKVFFLILRGGEAMPFDFFRNHLMSEITILYRTRSSLDLSQLSAQRQIICSPITHSTETS